VNPQPFTMNPLPGSSLPIEGLPKKKGTPETECLFTDQASQLLVA
jgi:hypothetical protein